MKLADLLSDMIAGGADLGAVSAVVEAARRQDAVKDQRRREMTATRVAKHRAARKANPINDEPIQPAMIEVGGTAVASGNACNARNALQPSPPPSLPPGPPNPPTPTPVVIPPLPAEAAPKGASPRGSALPDDWQPKPRHFAMAASVGLSERWVHDRAQAMREWAGANLNRPVARKANWDQAFDGWLRRDAPAAKAGRTLPLLMPVAGAPLVVEPRVDFGGGVTAPERLVLDVIRRGEWLDGWGPKRGRPGCRLPQRILDALSEAAA